MYRSESAVSKYWKKVAKGQKNESNEVEMAAGGPSSDKPSVMRVAKKANKIYKLANEDENVEEDIDL